jgi:hypothetical protein
MKNGNNMLKNNNKFFYIKTRLWTFETLNFVKFLALFDLCLLSRIDLSLISKTLSQIEPTTYRT